MEWFSIFSFWAVCILFPFLALLCLRGLLVLCWTRMVRIDVVFLFLVLEGKHSVFYLSLSMMLVVGCCCCCFLIDDLYQVYQDDLYLFLVFWAFKKSWMAVSRTFAMLFSFTILKINCLISILVLSEVLIIWGHIILLVSSAPPGWTGRDTGKWGFLLGGWGKLEGDREALWKAPSNQVIQLKTMELGGLSVSQGFCNKLPQTQWNKTTQFILLQLWKSSLKSRLCSF